MTSEAQIDALRNSECFRGLGDDALRKVASLAQPQSYAQGEEIFHELEPGETLFIIVSGVMDVMISRPLEAGPGIKIAPLKPGACFGEITLIDECFRSASVIAHLDSEVLCIPDAELRNLFQADHEIGYVFMLNVARILSERIRDANMRLRNSLSGLYV